MKAASYVVAMAVIAWSLMAAPPADAQAVVPWFNGVGLSLGGGQVRFRGAPPTTVATLIGPVGTSGAFAAGLTLTLGTRRWALLLPEFHAHSSFGAEQVVPGTLTLDGVSLPFETTTRSTDVYAVLAGGQVAVVPSGRVWVRGGIGSGSLGSSLATDQGVAIDLSQDLGLALSAAAGVRMWVRPIDGGKRFSSLDLEAHYLRVRSGTLHVAVPSVRIGWNYQFVPLRP